MIRIAVIDDHEMVREGLKAILQAEADFEIVAARASADRIVEMFEETRPNVVLLDARLPGTSGPEACATLVAAHPEATVLIVSTYSDEDLVDQCIRAGAKGYVLKDIERFTLKQAIRDVDRGQAAVSPQVAANVFRRWRGIGPPPERAEGPALTEGQLRILSLISEGFTNRQIAERVHLSENTVKSHIQEIFRELDVRNRVEAALRATREGWV
jgi:two-component system response regulator DevR